jgi:hypothetical protein
LVVTAGARRPGLRERDFDNAAVFLALNQHCLLEDVLADHFAVALNALHALAEVGECPLEFDVSGVFALLQ